MATIRRMPLNNLGTPSGREAENENKPAAEVMSQATKEIPVPVERRSSRRRSAPKEGAAMPAAETTAASAAPAPAPAPAPRTGRREAAPVERAAARTAPVQAAPAAEDAARAARQAQQAAMQQMINEENLARQREAEQRYASAFPAWDLLPPQILVRRVTRKQG